MPRKRIQKCVQCKRPLKHLQLNQWMCDQSPSVCNQSAKMVYIAVVEEEE